MNIKFEKSVPKDAKVLILPCVLVDKKINVKPFPTKIGKMVLELAKAKKFEAKPEEIHSLYFHNQKPEHVVLIGLGKKEKLNGAKVRDAFASAFKKAKSFKEKTISVLLYDPEAKFVQEAAEGIFLSSFNLAVYKTGKAAEELIKHEIDTIKFICDEKTCGEKVKRAHDISNAVNKVKLLVNAPANLLSPQAFAEEAKLTSKKFGYKIEILEKAELKKKGLNTFLAVNAGADTKEQEARLVILQYMPVKNQAPVAIVGKGIIFDTGGYNLKPSKSLDDMQSDKAGACAVLGVFELLSKLKIKQNVVGIMPITENLVGPRAFKPADVIKSYSGKTIEIIDTDAEGRLILADALSYAVKNFKPRFLIDLATLTGACVVALGDRYTAIMGNNSALKSSLIQSGKNTDELLWPLPIHPDFMKKTKSKIADLQNLDHGTGWMAGSSKAGAFLKCFVEKTKWAHLDIAGTAYTNDPKPYEQNRGTGYGVRLLIDFLQNLK